MTNKLFSTIVLACAALTLQAQVNPGMPVSNPSDGIFIHNSKKVAIR